MKSLRMISQDKKEVEIASEDIRNMIEGFESVEAVRDVSNSMKEEVFAFDVTLDSSHIEEILESQMNDLYYRLDDDEEAEEALFEQAQYISDAIVDSLKEYVENRYGIDDFNTAYDVYSASVEDGISFTMTISFGKIKHGRLYELASNLNSERDSNFR